MKKRSSSRAGLSEDAIAWLAGTCGTFGLFKPFTDRLELWEKFGDPSVATWDKRHCSWPLPIKKEEQ